MLLRRRPAVAVVVDDDGAAMTEDFRRGILDGEGVNGGGRGAVAGFIEERCRLGGILGEVARRVVVMMSN